MFEMPAKITRLRPLATDFDFGEKFEVEVGIENTGNTDEDYRIWIYLKDKEGNWISYAYHETGTYSPGDRATEVISTVAPGEYDLRIPAFSTFKVYGSNPLRATVWNGEELDDEMETKVYNAVNVSGRSYNIRKVCACEDVDEDNQPVNCKTTFSSDEDVYFYCKVDYVGGTARVTFTHNWEEYLPYTGKYDIPSGKNYEWYAVWWRYKPLLIKGTHTYWFQANGKMERKSIEVS